MPSDLDERAEKAWEDYDKSVVVPEFDEQHHRYHTPNRPLDTCPTCLFIGWAESETGKDHDMFVIGYKARAAETRDG